MLTWSLRPKSPPRPQPRRRHGPCPSAHSRQALSSGYTRKPIVLLQGNCYWSARHARSQSWATQMNKAWPHRLPRDHCPIKPVTCPAPAPGCTPWWCPEPPAPLLSPCSSWFHISRPVQQAANAPDVAWALRATAGQSCGSARMSLQAPRMGLVG